MRASSAEEQGQEGVNVGAQELGLLGLTVTWMGAGPASLGALGMGRGLRGKGSEGSLLWM